MLVEVEVDGGGGEVVEVVEVEPLVEVVPVGGGGMVVEVEVLPEVVEVVVVPVNEVAGGGA